MTIVFIVKQNNYMTKPILLLSQTLFMLHWIECLLSNSKHDLKLTWMLIYTFHKTIRWPLIRKQENWNRFVNLCKIAAPSVEKERQREQLPVLFHVATLVMRKNIELSNWNLSVHNAQSKKKLRQNSNCSEKTTTAFHQWKQKKRQTDILYIALHSRAL